MKNFITFALGILMSVAVIHAGDKMEDKIKTVNLQGLILESESGKEAVAELQKVRTRVETELKQISAELQRIEDELKKLRTDMVNKKAVMSATAQADSERKIRDFEYKKGELQSKGQRIVQDAQNDYAMEEMRVMQPLFTEFAEIAAQYAKEKDIYIVIDVSSGRVIYQKEGLDATSDIMKMVNKKHEQKTALAKNKAPKAPTKAA